MNLIIRQEISEDYKIVYKLIKDAFDEAENTDGDEHKLVKRLRKSKNYIPQLSLVASIDNEIVGHILLSKLSIENNCEKYESLALAPLSVSPKYQRMGIGSKLINKALSLAKELGYNSVFVLGDENYYPKFGFKESIHFGIRAPFEVPSKNFMAIELESNSLKKVYGDIVYAKEFFEK